MRRATIIIIILLLLLLLLLFFLIFFDLTLDGLLLQTIIRNNGVEPINSKPFSALATLANRHRLNQDENTKK